MRKTTIVAVATTMSLSMPLAQADTNEDYMVRVLLRSGTALIAQPSVQVHAGEAATIEVSGAYSIRITASPDQAMPGNILLASSVTVKSPDTLRTGASTVSLQPGKKMTFDLAPPMGTTEEPIHVELSATPVAR